MTNLNFDQEKILELGFQETQMNFYTSAENNEGKYITIDYYPGLIKICDTDTQESVELTTLKELKRLLADLKINAQ